MKPRKILTNSARVALASFGRMLLQEGAVWAARKIGRKRGKGRRRLAVSPAIAPLIEEGARFLETQWNQWLAVRSGSRARPGSRGPRADGDGAVNGAARGKKRRKRR